MSSIQSIFLYIPKRVLRHYFTDRTRLLLRLDWWRYLARFKTPSSFTPKFTKLHLACGERRVEGWVNADMLQAEVRFDVMTTPWPFADGAFSVIVCQQMIEHFDLETEGLPILKEMRRVCAKGGELWMSTPDLEMLCQEYLSNRGVAAKDYMIARDHGLVGDEVPPQQYVNLMIYAMGHHRNLFDFELLAWALERSGWTNVRRVREADLLSKYPEFPARNDDYEALAICATAK